MPSKRSINLQNTYFLHTLYACSQQLTQMGVKTCGFLFSFLFLSHMQVIYHFTNLHLSCLIK